MKKRTLIVAILSLFATFSVSSGDDPADKWARALFAAQQGKSQQAVEILDQVIQANPKKPLAYYHRGREQFRLGKIKQSISDFDQFVELEPKAASSQWERGIAYYYGKKYAEGAKQFELYQTYHDQDVENSVWRYLCVAAIEGVDKASKGMLPIERDPRVPMMEIFELYRGGLKPEDVFKAAEHGDPGPEQLKQRLFYANLYVGLWYEARGEKEKAKPLIQKAAQEFRISHYMGDVAHIHALRYE